MTRNSKHTGIRRALMAGVFVAAGVLTVGVATAPAQAQYYPYQYNQPYYQNNGGHYWYWRHLQWMRWHQYWRWYHQNYQ